LHGPSRRLEAAAHYVFETKGPTLAAIDLSEQLVGFQGAQAPDVSWNPVVGVGWQGKERMPNWLAAAGRMHDSQQLGLIVPMAYRCVLP